MYILPLFFMPYIEHTFINIPAILYICLHMFFVRNPCRVHSSASRQPFKKQGLSTSIRWAVTLIAVIHQFLWLRSLKPIADLWRKQQHQQESSRWSHTSFKWSQFSSTWMSQKVKKRSGSVVYNPNTPSLISRWNHPLILTIDPNFQRDIQAVGSWDIWNRLGSGDFFLPNFTRFSWIFSYQQQQNHGVEALTSIFH